VQSGVDIGNSADLGKHGGQYNSLVYEKKKRGEKPKRRESRKRERAGELD